MVQPNKNLDGLSKNELNRIVTVNFLNAFQEIVKNNVFKDIKTESELAAFLDIKQGYISKLKSDENRYVTLDMILRIVNILGANSNKFFLMSQTEKEKLLRDGFKSSSIRKGHVTTITNSKVSNYIQGPVFNGDNHKGNITTTLKIIEGLPAKDKKELKEYFNSISEQNAGLQNVVADLKKTLARHEKALKEKNAQLEIKEKKLSEISQKYITLLEQQNSRKK